TIVLKTPAPPPQTARCTADNLRRLDPADLAAHGSQHDLANRHGPLQGRWRIEHRRPPGRHSGPPGPAERTEHLLRKADRSCAPYILPRRTLDLGHELRQCSRPLPETPVRLVLRRFNTEGGCDARSTDPPEPT